MSSASTLTVAISKKNTRNALCNIKSGYSRKVCKYEKNNIRNTNDTRWNTKILPCQQPMERHYGFYKADVTYIIYLYWI